MEGETARAKQNYLSSAVWYGKGAITLGLTGEVLREDFEKLFNGFRTLKG
jgi:hypothetical protein